jgi:hypothetical protein
MRIAAAAFALATVLTVPALAHAGGCGSHDPAGRYQGTAKLLGATVIAVTLNLRCEGGAYVAQFYTDQGDFPARDAGMSNGRLVIRIDTGATKGELDLDVATGRLDGVMLVAGAKGPLNLTRTGDALSAAESAQRLDLTAAQWREDLAYLAIELPKRHANAFAFISRADFESRVTELARRIPTMNGDEVFVAPTQLVNAIGDGHTGVVSPPDHDDMPIELQAFGSDIRVVAVGPGLEQALGAKVLKIGGTPIAEAHRRALTLTPAQELPELREGRVAAFLGRGLTLHGLGITPERDRAVYTLEDDAGRVFDVAANGLGPDEKPKMTSVRSTDDPRWQNPDDAFWCKALPEARAAYCAWHGYPGLRDKAKAMWRLLDQHRPQKLIIDMRDNGGGDNTVGYAQIVKPLKARADYNRKGRLYVLIGPLTFSAAMNNAAQFQDETNAILVGQTIGERPNSYQEPRSIHLPNSHLVVRASTLYYTFRKSGENAVRPTKEIIPSWAETKAGRDPELEWALAQPAE